MCDMDIGDLEPQPRIIEPMGITMPRITFLVCSPAGMSGVGPHAVELLRRTPLGFMHTYRYLNVYDPLGVWHNGPDEVDPEECPDPCPDAPAPEGNVVLTFGGNFGTGGYFTIFNGRVYSRVWLTDHQPPRIDTTKTAQWLNGENDAINYGDPGGNWTVEGNVATRGTAGWLPPFAIADNRTHGDVICETVVRGTKQRAAVLRLGVVKAHSGSFTISDGRHIVKVPIVDGAIDAARTQEQFRRSDPDGAWKVSGTTATRGVAGEIPEYTILKNDSRGAPTVEQSGATMPVDVPVTCGMIGTASWWGDGARYEVDPRCYVIE